MKTNRRNFLQIMGAGAAGVEFAAAVPSAAAQAENVAKTGGARMKMVMRIDDVGYTNICNAGAFETIEHGVASSCDTMLDTPGAVDALERLKSLPWISVGWHAHFWGGPVLDPSKVPSMVIKEDGRIRFRKDLRTASNVVFEEALAECRAQIERCVKILGRAPDTGPGGGEGGGNAGGGGRGPGGPGGANAGGGRGPGGAPSAFSRAMAQACDEYGVVGSFSGGQSFDDNGKMTLTAPPPKWASRKIYTLNPGPAYRDLSTDSVTELEKYDPFLYYSEDRAHLKEIPRDCIVEQSWHPGYVDYYVYRLGDYGPNARNFIPSRTKNVEALCSERMKNWIKENRIELINYRDALYGTDEYQNHLKVIGSDLCMI